MKKITMLLALLVITLLGVSACGSAVSQQEYDRVKDELVATQSQITSLQSESAEAELIKAENEALNTQYDTLKGEYDELQDKYEDSALENEELNRQYDAIKGEYDTLKAQHDELNLQYAAAIEGIPEIEIITEEDLEQAIFELINQARTSRGLDELILGVNLYKTTRNHSRSMATAQRLEEPDEGSYQEVIRATGYTRTQTMAEAIFTIWKNTDRYEIEFLSDVTIYGAVGAYKSGEIFYITYVAGIFR